MLKVLILIHVDLVKFRFLIMRQTLFAFFQLIIKLRFEIPKISNSWRLSLLLVSKCLSNLIVDLIKYLQVLSTLLRLELLAHSCSLLLKESLGLLTIAFLFILHFAFQLLDLVLNLDLEAVSLLSDGVVHLEPRLWDQVVSDLG